MVASKTKLNHISVTQAVDLDSMETGIATNGANISTNATNIGNNTSSISTNTANISNNASAISTNTSNNSTNTSNISTNAANISSNDGDIANLQQDVNDIETKTDFISVTQAVNLDTMESDISTNAGNISTHTDISTNTRILVLTRQTLTPIKQYFKQYVGAQSKITRKQPNGNRELNNNKRVGLDKWDKNGARGYGLQYGLLQTRGLINT